MSVNIYPDKYRGVSVTTVGGALDLESLRAYFVGKQAYFKTRYAVVSGTEGGVPATAIVRIHTAATPSTGAVRGGLSGEGEGEGELFLPILDVTMLATADETVVVDDPEIDTGVPSELARAARERAPGSRAVVVHGRYEHISFIIDAQPLQVLVREVIPPEPAKLVDQAARVLAVREDLPPIELIPDVVDLREVAAAHPAAHYLLPCRGSGFVPQQSEQGAAGNIKIEFLDEHPAEGDWLMLGCTRSQQIHGAFYDRDAPQVSFCPLERPASPLLTLTKCCLQDDDIVRGDHSVSVPWGSSLERVSEALEALVALAKDQASTDQRVRAAEAL